MSYPETVGAAGTALVVRPKRREDPAGPGEPHDWRTVPTWEETGGVKLEANYFCRGRNTKQRKYCRWRAGHATDHEGMGRCRRHGGRNPVKHGLYRKVQLPHLRKLVDDYASQDPEVLRNLDSVLARQRAVMDLHLARSEIAREQVAPDGPLTQIMKAFAEDSGSEHPLYLAAAEAVEQVEEMLRFDIVAFSKLTDAITKTRGTIDKQESANYLTRKQVKQLLSQIGHLFLKVNKMPDGEQRARAFAAGVSEMISGRKDSSAVSVDG